MNGLLQFLQAASNTAADTVAAPVDLLSMVLRKAGVPIPQAPVGGSDWMKSRGLIADVPQSGASLAGETMGLLAPVVAAAKAPQIARGLLDLGDDFQRYNQALGPAGASQAVVWHGSPHKFDKFDSSKIGTERGLEQGWGAYASDAQRVARESAGPGGVVYAVDVPDEQIGALLGLQQKVKAQPKEVRRGVMKAIGRDAYKDIVRFGGTGSDVYNGSLANLSQREASELLLRSGVPGLSYQGNGTRNVVLFNPDALRFVAHQ